MLFSFNTAICLLCTPQLLYVSVCFLQEHDWRFCTQNNKDWGQELFACQHCHECMLDLVDYRAELLEWYSKSCIFVDWSGQPFKCSDKRNPSAFWWPHKLSVPVQLYLVMWAPPQFHLRWEDVVYSKHKTIYHMIKLHPGYWDCKTNVIVHVDIRQVWETWSVPALECGADSDVPQ